MCIHYTSVYASVFSWHLSDWMSIFNVHLSNLQYMISPYYTIHVCNPILKEIYNSGYSMFFLILFCCLKDFFFPAQTKVEQSSLQAAAPINCQLDGARNNSVLNKMTRTTKRNVSLSTLPRSSFRNRARCSASPFDRFDIFSIHSTLRQACQSEYGPLAHSRISHCCHKWR